MGRFPLFGAPDEDGRGEPRLERAIRFMHGLKVSPWVRTRKLVTLAPFRGAGSSTGATSPHDTGKRHSLSIGGAATAGQIRDQAGLALARTFVRDQLIASPAARSSPLTDAGYRCRISWDFGLAGLPRLLCPSEVHGRI